MKALRGRTFPVSLRKAVGVLGAAWGSKRTHELGEGFINLSTKLLTLRGDNGRVHLHAVLDGIDLEEGTNTITGMNIHPMFAEVLVREGAGFFLKSDLTRVLSQIKARGGHPAVGCVLSHQHEHTPLGALEEVACLGGDRVHVGEAIRRSRLGGFG